MITNFPSRPVRNAGGNRSFSFVPVNHISAFPMIYKHRILQELVLLAGKQLLNGYATYETLAFSEKTDLTDDGIVVQAQISGFAPGDQAELLDLFYEMERMRFVVIITDAQGQPRIVGSKLNPLQFKSDFNSGERRADSNGISFSFYGTMKYKAPIYKALPVGPITYYNTIQSQSFNRNNCNAGSTGSAVLYTVAAGLYSADSQEAANNLALAEIAANGQTNANNLGACDLNELVIVPYTLTEGNGADFLDNNLLFNIGDAYANGFFNAGSGDFDMGRIGQTIIAQQNYYGGTVDSNGNPVTAWPYAVTATLQLKINGVVSPDHNLTAEFPADQPVGGLQSFQFLLEAGKTYEVICTLAQA